MSAPAHRPPPRHGRHRAAGGRLARLALALALGLSGGCGDPSSVEPADNAAEAAGGSAPACVVAPAPPAQLADLALAPGAAREGEMAGGATLRYRFTAAEGTFIDLAVIQEGIDLVLSLEDREGRCRTQVDSPEGPQGPELLPLVVEAGEGEAAGPLFLVLHAPDPAGAPGTFRIEVRALRPATAEDRQRVAAERAFADGEGERRRGSGESRQRALERDGAALLLFRQLGDPKRQADVLYARGRVLDAENRYAEAADSYQQALGLFRRQQRRAAMARTLTSLGRLYRLLGDGETSLGCSQEALGLWSELDDPAGVQRVLTNLARLYTDRGEWEQALTLFTRLLAGRDEAGKSRARGLVLHNLGLLHSDMGDPRQAAEAFAEALDHLDPVLDARQVAITQTALATAQAETGRLDEALSLFPQAIASLRGIGDRRELAVAVNNYCGALQERNELSQTRACTAEAVEIFAALADRSSLATSLCNLGLVHLRLGEPGKAETHYRRALTLALELGEGERQAIARLGLARIARLKGDLPAAQGEIEEALAGIEALRQVPASPELRAALLGGKQEHYRFYIDLLMERARRERDPSFTAAALAASERSRARSFLDRMAEGGWAPPADAAPELLAELAAVQAELRRLHELKWRLRAQAAGSPAGASSPAGEDLGRRLRWLLSRQLDLRSRLRREGPGPPAREPTSPLTGLEIQRRVLRRNDLLLEVALGEERSFLWAVSADRVQSFELPAGAEIEAVARETYERLVLSYRTGGQRAAEIALADLSALVLAPAAAALAGRGEGRLIVVADGALQYIPFAALPAPSPGGGLAADAPPLLQRWEVLSAPSASALATLRDRPSRPAPDRTLAVVADPVFAADDPRLGGRAGRSATDPFPLARLPFSAREAAALLAQVAAGERFAALGFDASRETVLSGALSPYRFVHFATHGVLDAETPELSGLAFSRFDAGGRAREGFLLAQELHPLELRAELVVLSACATALGKEVRGEGVTGLARGFLQAGARGVVVSLWEVEDEATAQLMERFYRGLLAEGLTPAAALRAAQESLRSEPRFAPPYYWAGFVLQGDG